MKSNLKTVYFSSLACVIIAGFVRCVQKGSIFFFRYIEDKQYFTLVTQLFTSLNGRQIAVSLYVIPAMLSYRRRAPLVSENISANQSIIPLSNYLMQSEPT